MLTVPPGGALPLRPASIPALAKPDAMLTIPSAVFSGSIRFSRKFSPDEPEWSAELVAPALYSADATLNQITHSALNHLTLGIRDLGNKNTYIPWRLDRREEIGRAHV